MYIYASPGVYTVSMRVYNPSGYGQKVITNYITVTAPPISGRVIEQGTSVFIGEHGLDVTHALNAVQGNPPDGTPVLTTIGWWASAADISTTAPTISINLNTMANM